MSISSKGSRSSTASKSKSTSHSNFVKLATCSLNQWSMDFSGNKERICASIYKAKQMGAKYRLGPELEISGYGCEDHFLELDTFHHSAEVLAEILESDLTDGIICDIGAPVVHNSVSYNCRVLCLNRRILCIRPKMYLADDGNYREPRWFYRWQKKGVVEKHMLDVCIERVTGQKSVPFGDLYVELQDTKVGCETCEELWTPLSPHIELGLLGVEIFTNGSGSHHNLRKLNDRLNLIKSATKKSGGIYLYSNQIGCDGGRLNFDGCCLISVNGEIVNQGKQFALTDVDVICSVVSLQQVRRHRMSVNSRNVQSSTSNMFGKSDLTSTKSIFVDFKLSMDHKIAITATPCEVKLFSFEEEIAYGPAMWCWDYLRRSGASGFFLPLSGGADSSATATIIGAMSKMVVEHVSLLNEFEREEDQVLKDVRKICGDKSYLPQDPKEFCNRIFHTAYLGTSNSSSGTKNFSAGLSEEIGAYHLYVNIDLMIQAILKVFTMVTNRTPQFRVHGGSYAENQALQNIQARLRMVFSYLLAQLLPWVRNKSGFLLVLGSANVDESLRGYLTKYDCSSADLNPIGGICKNDLKSFLYWAGQKNTLNYKILREIADSKPTAELEPITENYTQIDEIDMGMSYQELTIYGKLRKIERMGPVSMFKYLVLEWGQKLSEKLSVKQVAEKVKFFFKSYSMNRHKMTTLTPSVHMEGYSPEDNRHDLRQIFYNIQWPWQFKKIDDLVEEIEEGFLNKDPNLSNL